MCLKKLSQVKIKTYAFYKYTYTHTEEKNGFERNLWMKACWKMKFVKALLKNVSQLYQITNTYPFLYEYDLLSCWYLDLWCRLPLLWSPGLCSDTDRLWLVLAALGYLPMGLLGLKSGYTLVYLGTEPRPSSDFGVSDRHEEDRLREVVLSESL